MTSCPSPDPFVSVVAVLHDDEAIARSFVDDLHLVMREAYEYFEIILIDDASVDETARVLSGALDELENLRVMTLSRRHGESVALASGVESAIGDFVVTMSPRTDPPGLVPVFVERARTGRGVLFGVRTNPGNDSMPFRIGSSIFHMLMRRVTGLEMPSAATEFRVLGRHAVNTIFRSRDAGRNIRLWSSAIGYQGNICEYEEVGRGDGATRRTARDGWAYAIDTIVSGSQRPLRIFSVIGFVASLVNLLYALYVALVYLLKNDVAEGWTTMSMQMSVMFFLLFALLAVLCEYIGQIQSLARDRPAYDLHDERSSGVNFETDRRNVEVMIEGRDA